MTPLDLGRGLGCRHRLHRTGRRNGECGFRQHCSIGLVHFRAGAIFKLLTVLVDPEDDFNPINVSRRPLKWKIRTKKMID
jgi:hypothetical protein